MRIAVTLILVTLLLVYVVDVREVVATLRRCDPLWALAALAAFTLDRVLMSYKWGLLLSIRGYSVGLIKRLMVYCSAMMWGLALPSTVGADAIRVVLVRRFGVRVDDTLATILVERGIGFIVALVTAVAGLIILRTALPADPVYDYGLLIGIAGIAAAIALVLFSFSDTALSSLMRLLPAKWAASKLAGTFAKLHGAYQSLAADRSKLGLFAGLTLLEHLILVVCYGVTAVALGVAIDALFLFAAVPLAILVSRLPVSLDGIGVYEAIFMGIMALSGVAPEDSLAISLAARALQIIVWLPWWLALSVQTGGLKPPVVA